MSIGKEPDALETAIGYRFSDITYLENALTHSSYANELKKRGSRKPSNERLEFLGDAVLQIIVSDALYKLRLDLDEGDLTKIRQQVVCGKTIGKIAEDLSIGEYIHVADNDIRHQSRVLADTFEALVAAIYLDSESSGRKDEGRRVIFNLLHPALRDALQTQDRDYKTQLINFIEQDGSADILFTVENESGPDNDKRFFVVCRVNNNVVGAGNAPTKKEAEQRAALAALELFGFFREKESNLERL